MERTPLWFSVSDFEELSNREDHLRVLRVVDDWMISALATHARVL